MNESLNTNTDNFSEEEIAFEQVLRPKLFLILKEDKIVDNLRFLYRQLLKEMKH